MISNPWSRSDLVFSGFSLVNCLVHAVCVRYSADGFASGSPSIRPTSSHIRVTLGKLAVPSFRFLPLN